MELDSTMHLTYCTNIHPGETWPEIFEAIKKHVPTVKSGLDGPFGIGLRLSGPAAAYLDENESTVSEFRQWLEENNCYVFTMNGFPYGKFHETVVKENVHRPDWLDREREFYTQRMANVLVECMGELTEAGISTSPVSYRHWHEDDETVIRNSIPQFMEVLLHFHKIYEEKGKIIHLDIEPEPDGILENSEEFIRFYNDFLIPLGKEYLAEQQLENGEELIRRHIRLCYDVCHFSVEFEKAEEVIASLKQANVPVGKIQISAALMASDPGEKAFEMLDKFDEATYLHQAVGKTGENLVKFRDLGPLLSEKPELDEVRCHFHVPIFTDTYGGLESTQQDIVRILELCKADPFTDHLEIETYTWQVLPEEHTLDLSESIRREIDWVREQWQKA